MSLLSFPRGALALDMAKQHYDEGHLGDARFFARREQAITALSSMSCEEAVLSFPRDDEAASLSALAATGILRATMSCAKCGEDMTMCVGVKASVMEWKCRKNASCVCVQVFLLYRVTYCCASVVMLFIAVLAGLAAVQSRI
jgi:hypothetical protein